MAGMASLTPEPVFTNSGITRSSTDTRFSRTSLLRPADLRRRRGRWLSFRASSAAFRMPSVVFLESFGLGMSWVRFGVRIVVKDARAEAVNGMWIGNYLDFQARLLRRFRCDGPDACDHYF